MPLVGADDAPETLAEDDAAGADDLPESPDDEVEGVDELLGVAGSELPPERESVR